METMKDETTNTKENEGSCRDSYPEYGWNRKHLWVYQSTEDHHKSRRRFRPSTNDATMGDRI
jgi:hypothetical protein